MKLWNKRSKAEKPYKPYLHSLGDGGQRTGQVHDHVEQLVLLLVVVRLLESVPPATSAHKLKNKQP